MAGNEAALEANRAKPADQSGGLNQNQQQICSHQDLDHPDPASHFHPLSDLWSVLLSLSGLINNQ